MSAKKPEILTYFIISIPNQGSPEKTISTLKSNVESRGGEHYELDKLPIQRLKVGTLDKLIALSDDLGRVDSFGKNVVQKLHRTYAELEDNTDQLLSVYNKSIRGYITNFLWDEGHFNPRAQLRDLVQVIHGNMVKTAEHLRKWTSSLSEIQNQLTAIERKKTGSLMNKSLNEYINHEDWYNGDYITSALVVVPNTKKDDFLAAYEFFEDTPAHKAYYDMINKKHEQQQGDDDNDRNEEASPLIDNIENEMNKLAAADCRVVVPNSQKFLTNDAEFSLYRVLLLKRGYQWFKYVAMKNGYAVRDFNISELESQDDEKTTADLRKKETSQKKKLKLFCKNTFSETFANWMHLKIIRSFVESVLRFGLPVDFTISVVKPIKGNEKKLLKQLEQKYSFLLDKILQQKGNKDNENEIDYSGQLTDFYPFVYVQMKVEL
mmetsp:Transcript_37137/g.32837  ORF Transcript_37137/g.32837 Transcript_37137/m.32837 type:complete len:434 (+) Transcript_37137:28-1329(+)